MQRASPSEDHSAVRGRLRAIGLMCVALVLFSALDATAKYLISRDHIPVGEVVWLRFLGQTVYMVAIFHAFALPALLKTVQLKAQLFRSCLMLGTTAFNFLAVKYLRLDQTITIVFLTPLVVALLAGPVLGEWVGWRRMVAILVGFCGILIAVRPGVASIHPAIGYSVLSMLAYAGFMLVTRRIAAFDPPFVTLFYSMLAGTAGMAPHAVVEWVTPDSVVVWLRLAALGALGGTGHFLFILAYRLAPASTVAPFLYFQLIAMVTLGYVVFEDVPNLWQLAGALIVVGSGVYLFHRERTTRVASD